MTFSAASLFAVDQLSDSHAVQPPPTKSRNDDIERTAGELVTPQTQQAIDQGLAWLASRQQSDGAFTGSRYSRNVAVVSLAAMAFMSGGSTPGRGLYGRNVNRCLDYILAHVQPESGYIIEPSAVSHGPMYGHGFATLFLAEAYGMTPRRDLRGKLVKAVELIVNTQNDEGGWRYQPERREADISVTICEVMALRAARNAGLYVPHETIDRCIEYVKSLQSPDGGFMYMKTGGPSEFPRSAAGVVALYSAGVYQGDAVTKGLDYLMQFPPKQESLIGENRFFYAHYYAVQAMWHAGGDYWRTWYPAVRDLLLRRRKDGYWSDDICPEYGTAMACIILQIPNNYLPIFQR